MTDLSEKTDVSASDGLPTGERPGPGYVLGGKYELVKKLGAGGMGSVWEAKHLSLSSRVAVKLMEPSLVEDVLARSRFDREAQAAAGLRSPHVVQTFDHGVENSIPFIVMELMEGESLAERLDANGKLSARETSRVLTHVSRAIQKAHDSKLIHRDLKPGNIFIVHNDDEDIVKVLDFGIAKMTDPAVLDSNSPSTATDSMVGTPFYMSPEQIEGAKNADFRTDIWALGVIVYECLLGRRPFESETLYELMCQICQDPIPLPSAVGEVPAGFDEWFATAADRDVEARFQSAREMADAFRALVDPSYAPTVRDEPKTPAAGERNASAASVAVTPSRGGVSTTTSSAAAEVPRPAASKFNTWVGGALAVVLVGGGLWVWQTSRDGPDPNESSAPGVEAVSENETNEAERTTPGTENDVSPVGTTKSAVDTERADGGTNEPHAAAKKSSATHRPKTPPDVVPRSAVPRTAPAPHRDPKPRSKPAAKPSATAPAKGPTSNPGATDDELIHKAPF